MEEFVTNFEASLSNPLSYLQPSEQLRSSCVDGAKKLFDFYKSWSACFKTNVPTGPLSELYTDGFDNEQVWAEIELMNEPVLKSLKKHIKKASTWTTQPPLKTVATIKKRRKIKATEVEVDTNGDVDEIEEELDSGDDSVRVKKSTEKRSIVDDRFFKLAEMEKFLERSEQQENDAVNESGSGSDDEDDVDFFADQDSDNASGERPHYDQFFDAPEPGATKPPQGSKEQEDVEDEIGDDEASDAGEGEEGGFPNDEPDVEDEIPAVDNTEIKDEPLSTFEKKQLKMKTRIEALEAVNLAPRAWQLGGEANAKNRPLNSLLAEDLSFDHMTRPAPVITEETTATLEDIIKQRILDEAWDDVGRKIKPTEKPYDYSRSQPLDQGKSKLSLAEVYEQEYLKQTQEEDIKEDDRHTDIKELMKKLFVKLDALSNFHFTPKPPKAEVKIVPNVPAIQMEEVAPTAVSEAARVAPEEIQAKSQRPQVGETERTDTDRKHDRRLKKRRKRLQIAEKNQRDKIVAKLRPGLGNKYTKKSLEKKLKDKEQHELVDKSLKSSSRFFAALQEEVKEQVKSAKKGHESARERTTSAQQYKL
ncbi:U3 small nucleolar ribonucleoprotein protein MPP10-like [Halichondria panicea]|uniref:U3 small nucleolar ribonucleoprotein protein MPP10-like n=1 Tax=Halichondria panicea TaxID=6063 RepID=UPI00312BA754